MSDALSNPGYDDRFTCPECYRDLPYKTKGKHKCPECGTLVNCRVETQDVSVCERAEADEDSNDT